MDAQYSYVRGGVAQAMLATHVDGLLLDNSGSAEDMPWRVTHMHRRAKLTTLWEGGVYLGIRSVIGEKHGRRCMEDTDGATTAAGGEMDGEGGGVCRGRAAELVARGHGGGRAARARRARQEDDGEGRAGDARCCSRGPGCRALLSGKSRRGHSEDCRMRSEMALAGDPCLVLARHRENVFLVRAIKKKDRKRRRAEGWGGSQPARHDTAGAGQLRILLECVEKERPTHWRWRSALEGALQGLLGICTLCDMQDKQGRQDINPMLSDFYDEHRAALRRMVEVHQTQTLLSTVVRRRPSSG